MGGPRWAEAAADMAAVTSIVQAQQLFLSRIDSLLAADGLTFARYEVLLLLSLSRAGCLPLGKVGVPPAGPPGERHQRRRPP